MRKLAVIMASIAAIAPQPTLAWGDKGHEVVAVIARDRLTSQARAWVDAILAKDGDTLTAPDMVARATWADKWRDHDHRETASWHFVDQELAKPDLKTACFNYPAPADPPSVGPAQDCIVDKLNEFEKELAAPATPDAERLLALKYVLHFVGDLHQPLHASDNEDRGGNCVHVSLGGQRTTNLHSFWDTAVLDSLGTDPQVIATNLSGKITPAKALAWSKGKASDWAAESFAAAKAYAYTINTPAGCPADAAPIDLSAAYRKQALATAEVQIEKAGVRLAMVLNAAASQATAR